MPEKNLGLILEPIQPDTGFLGGVAGDTPDLLPSGDWEPYLPDFEHQRKNGLETMNCVQYSRLNASEIQAKFHGKQLNLSDRFLGWASGCTPNGNTYTACDFWFRQAGSCVEDRWPWSPDISTWERYYEEPPADIKAEAKKLMDEWVIGMRVFVPVTVEGMREALKKGPIWFCNSTHSMVIYRVDDRIRFFDTYLNDGNGRGSFPLSYINQIVAAYLVPFTPKENVSMPIANVKLPPNSLVIVADNGERLMNVDGSKLYKDEAGKILLEVTARNSKDGRSGAFPIIHVKAADVANIPRVNLKNEPL